MPAFEADPVGHEHVPRVPQEPDHLPEWRSVLLVDVPAPPPSMPEPVRIFLSVIQPMVSSYR